MHPIVVVMIALASLAMFAFLLSVTLFLYVSFSWNSKKNKEVVLPNAEEYKPHRAKIRAWIDEVETFPCQKMEMRASDGVILRGKYYTFYEDAPMELMFHGYRSDSVRDLSGGVLRAKKLGHNVFLVDQRGCGQSDGHFVTFGVKEHLDCLDWIEFILENVNKDATIILTGISMGASTVLMAGGYTLPKNVVGVLADCGFTSAEEIIKEVITQMHLPAKLIYPFIRFGGRVFGIDFNRYTAKDGVAKASLPTLFFHGTTDDFVPCWMSEVNYDLCASAQKKLVKIEGAGHGLSYVIDEENYLQAMRDFFKI
jgi:pimeloyl-ACP methyl ester carboxylesterase